MSYGTNVGEADFSFTALPRAFLTDDLGRG